MSRALVGRPAGPQPLPHLDGTRPRPSALPNDFSVVHQLRRCVHWIIIIRLIVMIPDQTEAIACKSSAEFLFDSPNISAPLRRASNKHYFLRTGTSARSDIYAWCSVTYVWLPSFTIVNSYIFNVRCLSTLLSYAGFSGAINYLSSKTCLFSNFCFSYSVILGFTADVTRFIELAMWSQHIRKPVQRPGRIIS